MQRLATSLRPLRHLGMMGSKPSRSASISSRFKSCAVVPDEPELGEFLDYMEKLKNYETVGVPQGAGTDTDDGFDLGRMRRLLQRLGNPHKQFKVKEIIDQSVEQEKGALTHFEFITLPNVNLHLLGAHQLQNAVTAACTALCLRDQGRRPELILLTEVSIAGGRSRIALASTLKEAWTKALLESGADFVDTRIMDDEKAIEDHGSCSLITSDPNKMMLASCENASIVDSVKLADQLLKSRSRDQPALIVVTGSLHVVSSLLAALHH
ncbi:Mur ligase middle domain [Musa troglodytarum]|uniref:Mur ligase middle domain n=1 Tax=Musa troglodytarum TaxID=320322 RepID=A0A9E7I3U5_9LILI|nr:Mur ligase middle domain [Musa troglodytarum]